MRGGKRQNSGPKAPVGPYGEKTALIRVPESIKSALVLYLDDYKKSVLDNSPRPDPEYLAAVINPPQLKRPIYSGKVAAGQSRFPSPAQDYEQEELDLHEHLVKNPPATFYYTVGKSYDSMIDAGILPNGLLIVDRSKSPRSSDIVLAIVNSEKIVKRLYKHRDVLELRSENALKNYPPITFAEGDELIIEGVVISCVTIYE